MKKIIYLIIACGLIFNFYSCQDDFLNLKPQDQITDVVYFKKPGDFKAYTTEFYGQLMGWKSPYERSASYNYMDIASDLSTYFTASGDLGMGTITITGADSRWNKPYEFIRSHNILLSRAESYAGNKSEIAAYVSEAYFFRAYAYFSLLKVFGGVPIVTQIMDTNSPELTSPRNSRYEVIELILSDLDKAIENLPTEQSIPDTEKGRLSKWGAMAFKARVLLYEATWRKYNGVSTDFEVPGGGLTSDMVISSVDPFLTEVISLTKEVMDKGGYEVWNYNGNAAINGLSNLYLFNLEDEGSNPAGLTKGSNKEFIIYNVYDYVLKQCGVNLSHTVYQMAPSRKLIDMFLCTDGLPASKSPLFQGYHKVGDEFKNRDFRLLSYINGSTTLPADGSVILDNGLGGYGNYKFAAYNYGTYRTANTESQNYSVLRLAEVYLMYAEALIEKNGTITDDQLNESVNLLRSRAGVAHLTNALVTGNGLNMKEEIRRERTLELYNEGFRYDDLKRWGILEEALNTSRCSTVVGDASYVTEFRDASGSATANYNPSRYVWGEEVVETAAGPLKCIVISSKSNHNVAKKHYLWPIPQDQINLNPNLVQNPGYTN